MVSVRIKLLNRKKRISLEWFVFGRNSKSGARGGGLLGIRDFFGVL